MLLNCGVGEDSWESLGLQGHTTNQSSRKSVLNIHWKDWCWSWNSNTLATWCKELTHWKRPWCWERLKAGIGGDNRGLNGLLASPTRWTWVWATPVVGDGQETLACCSPWGAKSQTRLSDWTELITIKYVITKNKLKTNYNDSKHEIKESNFQPRILNWINLLLRET